MKRIAPLLVLMAGCLWGVIGVFVRKLNVIGFDSMEIVALRAISTSILLLVFLLIYDIKMLRIRLKDFWCFIGTGILSIVFFNFCYFKAMTLTSLSVAAVLLYTAPVIVMLLSAILFHEKITVTKILALVATFVGCILVTGVVGFPGSVSVGGILAGLGAGLGYALYSIFSRYALERGYHPFTISFYTFLLAMVGTIPFCGDRFIINIYKSDAGVIIFCLTFGLVSTVIPYIVYTLGLKEMENSRASVIASIEPVTATLLGVFVYHEKLTISNVIGIILVMCAIIICSGKQGKQQVNEDSKETADENL